MKIIKNLLKTSKSFFHIQTLLKTKKKSSSFITKKINSLKYPLYYYLLLTNLTIYLSWNSYLISKTFLKKNFMLSQQNISQLRIHTLITHAFTHLNFLHLFSNGLGIYFLGSFIEKTFGPRLMFNLYIIGAITGGIMHLGNSQRGDHRYCVGASSSVSALLSFFIFSFPGYKLYVFPVPFPVRAWVLGVFYFFYTWNMSRYGGGEVGHSGHLGGFLAGAAYYFMKRRPLGF